MQTKFNYAWGLIKSNKREEQQDGVRLLSEIFRASPERRRECLYYLGKSCAMIETRMGNRVEVQVADV